MGVESGVGAREGRFGAPHDSQSLIGGVGVACAQCAAIWTLREAVESLVVAPCVSQVIRPGTKGV